MSNQAEQHNVKLLFPGTEENEVKALVEEHKGDITRSRRLESSTAPAGFPLPSPQDIVDGFHIATAMFGTAAAAVSFVSAVTKLKKVKAELAQAEAAASKEKERR